MYDVTVWFESGDIDNYMSFESLDFDECLAMICKFREIPKFESFDVHVHQEVENV